MKSVTPTNARTKKVCTQKEAKTRANHNNLLPITHGLLKNAELVSYAVAIAGQP